MVEAWWNDIVQWVNSVAGQRLITTTILPFLAILVGGILAGLIARGGIKRLITQRDREQKAGAVAALIAAARRAAVWSTLSAPEKDHVDYQSSQTEVRLRLLPVVGAGLAADWAAHYLTALKKNSANYSFQAEQDLADLQDGLIAWQAKPSKASKLFAQDLAAWKYDSVSAADDELVTKQREWSAQQAAASPEPATTVLPQPAAK